MSSVEPAPVASADVVPAAVAPAAVAPAPVVAAPVVAGLLTQIERPELPPTPPELSPLPADAVLTAAGDQTGSATGGIPFPDLAPPVANQPTDATFAPRTTEAVPTSAPSDDEPKKAKKKAGVGGSSSIKPIAVAALALAVIAGAVFFGMQLLGGTTIVSDLQTGDCVENFFETGEDGAFVEIFAVSTVECAQPHAYEVFAVHEALFPSDSYPGIDESFAIGQEFCLEQYETFIGGGPENLSTWDVWTFVPPEGSWSDDRRVQCLVGDFAETTPVTGTLQGAAG